MRTLIVLALLAVAGVGRAEDAFYRVPVSDRTLFEGRVPEKPAERADLRWPQARLDGAGEAYVVTSENRREGGRHEMDLLIRAPRGADVTGRLFVPAADGQAMAPIKFSVPAGRADPGARDGFYRAKVVHYEALLGLGIPGAAWFRHEADAARAMLSQPAPAGWPERVGRPRGSNDDTFGLFTGGRAVSENLQLDRTLLPRPGDPQETVPLASVQGITVREMDWRRLNEGKHPATDALAAAIPLDQHAVFFPSFAAAVRLLDEVDRRGTPVLQFAEPRAEDARVKQRYERQLCIPLTAIGRLLGPQVINAEAVTGSDAYLRVGSDVAVLFEPKDQPGLHQMLATQMALSVAGRQDVARVNGAVGGVAYTGLVSPDRSVCAYLADVGTNVVVTNSLAQLKRLVAVQSGEERSIAAAPEYTFFRDRYVRGEGGEAGFIVLTDATIRRWCSPRWRIADSRRTRAAGVMAGMQAQHVDALINGEGDQVVLRDDQNVGGMNLAMTARGVSSPVYGTLEFMTPIIELEMPKVTTGEAESYARWRDTYQRNWRNYFDPIAVRLSTGPNVLGADLTVMPLIAGSDYREMVEWAKGAKVVAGSGDPHGAMVQLVLALNGKGEALRTASQSAAVWLKAQDPFGWVGPVAAVYLEDDPVWDEMAKSPSPERFFEQHPGRIPAALYVESTDAAKLEAFVPAVRPLLRSIVPHGEEVVPYKGVSYLKLTSRPDQNGLPGGITLCVTTAFNALLVTPSEAIMKQSIDRRLAKREGEAAAKPARPWLGESFCVQVDSAGVRKALGGLFARPMATQMRQQAWGNLPILNEWRRRYPDKDPVEVHERLWQVRLVDPAGGRYVWSAELGTMESSTYGCPESPREGPGLPPGFQGLIDANFGMTFEDQGLRARAELHWEEGK